MRKMCNYWNQLFTDLKTSKGHHEDCWVLIMVCNTTATKNCELYGYKEALVCAVQKGKLLCSSPTYWKFTCRHWTQMYGQLRTALSLYGFQLSCFKQNMHSHARVGMHDTHSTLQLQISPCPFATMQAAATMEVCSPTGKHLALGHNWWPEQQYPYSHGPALFRQPHVIPRLLSPGMVVFGWLGFSSRWTCNLPSNVLHSWWVPDIFWPIFLWVDPVQCWRHVTEWRPINITTPRWNTSLFGNVWICWIGKYGFWILQSLNKNDALGSLWRHQSLGC